MRPRTSRILLLLLWGGLAAGGVVGSATAGDPARGDLAPWERGFRDADADGDGRLAPGEVPLSPAEFARADRDGDGALDAREAIRWYALADAKHKRGERDAWRRKFREADKDGDGVVTRAEFTAPDALFERFDRDGDGKVTWAEGLAYGVEEEVAKAFAKHDADLSGTLGRDEVPPDAQALVVAADEDGDGQLSGEEAYAFVHALTLEAEAADGAPAPGRPAGPAMTSGAGGPGATAPGGPGATAPGGPEATAPGAAPATAGRGVLELLAARFDGLDRDRDGALAREELPASGDLLARLDLDRDGRVDRPELALRQRRAAELVARGERLRARAAAQGAAAGLGPAAVEARGLLEAGRLEELARLMDEAELWLDRHAAAPR